MRLFTISSVAAGSIAAAALGLAGTANAAPSGPSTVEQTVGQLRAEGFNVILNKVGTGAQCTVSGVRPGQTFTRMDTDLPGPQHRGVITTVTAMTVYVDVTC